jgi:chromosome segregation protein
MRLKKIKVLGFKSFADKVELIFDDEITAIVGPNGCGKSNIADAFRWVMGEQSAKSMRGGNMLDVIFAGTTKRKPLNLSEVTLTFENNLGSLDVPYREVEITRRYHRNGDSEYLINGNVVRLKDVQALLIDVGVGKNAYCIFEQGKIDQVIQLNPEERRVIFESAAGISRFLMNEKETNRKLHDVDTNMKRLLDIRKEVAGQIEELEKQAEKAIKFKKLQEELKEAEIGFLSNKISETCKKKDSLKENLNQRDTKKNSQEEALKGLKDAFKEQREEQAEKEKSLKALEKHYFETKALLDVRSKEKETLKERIEGVIASQEKLTKELNELARSKDERTHEISQNKTQEDKVKSELDNIKKRYTDQEKKLKTVEQKVTSKQDELIDSHNKALKKAKEASETLANLRQLETRRDHLKERKQESIKQSAQLNSDLEKAKTDETSKQKELEALSQEVEKARDTFKKLDQEIKKHEESLDSLDQLYNSLKKDLINLQAKEKTLTKLKSEMEGFSSGSKTLLKKFPKLKKLYEYFKVQSGFENACAGFLKAYGDTLVAESKLFFEEVLVYAKDQNISDFSLILLPEKTDKYLSSLKEKVEENALTARFLNQKGVLSNLEEALSNPLPFEEIYTLDGFYFDRLKVVSRGSSQGQNLFLRDAELKQTIASCENISKDLARVESDWKEALKKKEIQQQERRELDKTIREKEMRLVEKNFHYQRQKNDIERISKTLGDIKAKELENETQISKIENELADLKAKAEKLEKEQEALQKAKAEIEISAKELQKELEFEKNLFRERSSELAICLDEERKTSHILKVLEVKNQEAVSLERKWTEELKTLEGQLAQFIEKEKVLTDDIASFGKKIIKEKEDVEKAEKSYVEIKSTLAEKEKSLESEEGALKKINELVQADHIALSRFETLENELRHQFSEQFGDIELKPSDKAIDKLDKEIRSLKQSLTHFSDVNLSATDSLDQHQARLDVLERDLNDLDGVKNDLASLIEKLRAESRTLFFETFEKIRANFKKNFGILFNGGEADLELSSEEDLLKAGVEIQAKPPGKQMRSINLLSGGEKCLTALALLFAIFEVKASPFCILDEIDAPLDDTNVGRFTEMVKHFKDKCQFIIITHNKRTMAMADMLYGVSMEEKGVSKILTMEFQKKEAQKEAMLV